MRTLTKAAIVGAGCLILANFATKPLLAEPSQKKPGIEHAQPDTTNKETKLDATLKKENERYTGWMTLNGVLRGSRVDRELSLGAYFPELDEGSIASVKELTVKVAIKGDNVYLILNATMHDGTGGQFILKVTGTGVDARLTPAKSVK